MKVFVFSVPHTGTRFLTNLLRDAGVEVQQVHFNGNYAPVIWRDVTAIVTQRDFRATQESWERRGRTDPDFDRTWLEMEEYIEEFDPYLFHVDDPDKRLDDIKAIEELIGQPLNPDFDVKVGHYKDGKEHF